MFMIHVNSMPKIFYWCVWMYYYLMIKLTTKSLTTNWVFQQQTIEFQQTQQSVECKFNLLYRQCKFSKSQQNVPLILVINQIHFSSRFSKQSWTKNLFKHTWLSKLSFSAIKISQRVESIRTLLSQQQTRPWYFSNSKKLSTQPF